MKLAVFMIVASVLLTAYGATIDLLHPTITKRGTYCRKGEKDKSCSRRRIYDTEVSKHNTAGLYITVIILTVLGTGLSVLVHVHRQDVINKELG